MPRDNCCRWCAEPLDPENGSAGGYCSKCQAAANDRLIAAAPELLEIARKALDTFNDAAKALLLLGNVTMAAGMVIAATATANVIAKAEGMHG